MSILRITKEFRYEGAHALLGYDGKCRHIHGHSYILYVTIKGEPDNTPCGPKEGMVIDFKALKSIVEENIIEKFDHALVLRKESPLVEEIAQQYSNMVIVDFQPTTENMICYFAQTIKSKLPEGISLHSLKLYETAGSYVEWYASDNN